MYYYDGSRYEGKWVNDAREGRGVMYYDDGIRYEGNWMTDERTGHGV